MRYWRLTPTEVDAIDDVTYHAMVGFMIKEARAVEKASKKVR